MSDQPSLFDDERPDPGRPMDGRFHHDGPDTERIAARLVAPRAGTQRAHVLEMFRTFPNGLTDYELWAVGKIGARPHVPGTRREELIADGWPIRDSGKRRRTDTNTPAIVWVLEEEALVPSVVSSPPKRRAATVEREYQRRS